MLLGGDDVEAGVTVCGLSVKALQFDGVRISLKAGIEFFEDGIGIHGKAGFEVPLRVGENAIRSPLAQSSMVPSVRLRGGIRKGRSGRLALTLKVTNSTCDSG